MCERASQRSPDLKNYTALGSPPVSKLPGSATDPPYVTTMNNFVSMLLCCLTYISCVKFMWEFHQNYDN